MIAPKRSLSYSSGDYDLMHFTGSVCPPWIPVTDLSNAVITVHDMFTFYAKERYHGHRLDGNGSSPAGGVDSPPLGRVSRLCRDRRRRVAGFRLRTHPARTGMDAEIRAGVVLPAQSGAGEIIQTIYHRESTFHLADSMQQEQEVLNETIQKVLFVSQEGAPEPFETKTWPSVP